MKKSRNTSVKPSVTPVASVAASSQPPTPPVKTTLPAQSKPVTALTMPTPRENRVSLEFVKPEAHHVFVAGSFNHWKPESTPLRPAGNGRWVGDLTVKPGRHEYLFVVDGQWIPDPNAKETVANPYGGTNSVLIVSE